MSRALTDLEQLKLDSEIELTRDAENRVSQIVITGDIGLVQTIDLTRDANGLVTDINISTS